MKLRLGQTADIPWIVTAERRPEYREFVGNASEEEHREMLANPDCRYLIAENEGHPIGFVLLRSLQSPHRNIELKRIVVTTPNRGWGTWILRHVMAMAFKELGAHRLWLNVLATNQQARAFFERLGFHADGILRDAFCRDGQHHSLVLMSMLEDEFARVGEASASTSAPSMP